MTENSKISMTTTPNSFFRLASALLPKSLLTIAAATTLLSSSAFAAPPNDLLANAIAITGSLPVTVGGTNIAATTESGEPRHTDQAATPEEDQLAPHKSVWWKWTSTVDGPVSISTQNSGSPLAEDPFLDTQVAVYTGGPTMGTLTSVIKKEDSDNRYANGWTYLTFTAALGTTYYIAVDGWRGDQGRISLTLSQGGTTPPPPTTNRVLTINVIPADSGTVSANPAPGENGYADGTRVTLTATVTGVGKFSGWTGGASTASRSVTVVMTANKTVNAVFNADTVLYGMLPDARVIAWLYHGSKFAGGVLVRASNVKIPGWRIAGSGDFNGDGNKDIVFQYATGNMAVWYMNDALLLGDAVLGTIHKDWQARAVGDFNGDGSADIGFQHTNGRMNIWTMLGTTFVRSRLVRSGTIYPGWTMASGGDVNGDNTDDLIVKHTNGRVHAWRMTAGNFAGASVLLSGKLVPSGWNIVGLTDVSLDDNLDVVIQSSTGRITAWFMTDMIFTGSASMRNTDAVGTKFGGTN